MPRHYNSTCTFQAGPYDLTAQTTGSWLAEYSNRQGSVGQACRNNAWSSLKLTLSALAVFTMLYLYLHMDTRGKQTLRRLQKFLQSQCHIILPKFPECLHQPVRHLQRSTDSHVLHSQPILITVEDRVQILTK